MNGVFPYFDPNSTTVLNATYLNNHVAATPLPIWIVFAAAALGFLALSFVYPLRNITGSLNTSRIAFSLIGGILCGYVAWLSPLVDSVDGMGVSEIVNGTAAVSIHSLYELPGSAIIFVIFSLLCFANFIYTLLQPELVVPEQGEMAGQVSAKAKAEGRGKMNDGEEDGKI